MFSSRMNPACAHQFAYEDNSTLVEHARALLQQHSDKLPIWAQFANSLFPQGMPQNDDDHTSYLDEQSILATVGIVIGALLLLVGCIIVGVLFCIWVPRIL